MDIEIKAWLFDILNAINEIDSFFSDTPKEFTFYQNDGCYYKAARLSKK